MQWQRGVTRRELRQGSGVDVDSEHIAEVLGSSEFYIYVPLNKRAKGLEALKQSLQTVGCAVEFPADSPLLPAEKYRAVKITNKGDEIPDPSLRRAHRWAHQRNLLHSFFKPTPKQTKSVP